MIFYLICKGDTISTNYIQDELTKNKSFFDSLDLNDKQREAVVTDADALQIIAGAGTGKTRTLLSKVKYLIEKKGIKEKDILVLSYSDNSVEDLKERLNNINVKTEGKDGVRVSTFHSFGYSFLDGDYNEEFLENVFIEFIKSKVLEKFSIYEDLKIYFRDKFSHNKKYNYNINIFYKQKAFYFYGKSIRSLNNTDVRTKEDFRIANFLTMNNIEFEYERKPLETYPGNNTIVFDFYLPDYDIYIEDMRLNEENKPFLLSKRKPKSLSGASLNKKSQRYISQINHKINFFLDKKDQKAYKKIKSKNNPILKNDDDSRLIIINSFLNDDFINDLKEQLDKCDVNPSPLLKNDKMSYLKDNNFFNDLINVKDYFDDSIKYFKEGLLKKENFLTYSFNNDREEFLHLLFFDYLDFYNIFLEKNKIIDYADMIVDATEKVKDINYKYILVDEYQDISKSRFKLLKKAKEVSGAKLVVVGDDWQSIFSFAGCDIKFFTKFERCFNDSKIVYLEESHRFSNQLIEATSDFIEDKNLCPKKLFSKRNDIEEPIVLKYFTGSNKINKWYNEISLIYNIISQMPDDENNKNVMILSRYNDNLDFVKRRLEDSNINELGKNISYNNFHTAKGLDADNVIIIDVNKEISGKGIPNIQNTYYNSSFIDFYNDIEKEAEEKRLFYVALTRTKNKVYLCSDRKKPSDYLKYFELIGTSEKLNESISFNTYEYEIEYYWNTKARKSKLKEYKCPICGDDIYLYLINSNYYIACSNFNECGWFVDDQISNKEYVFDDIGLCKRCKSGFKYKSDLKDKEFSCSNSSCRNSKAYIRKSKREGQKDLFDYKHLDNGQKPFKSLYKSQRNIHDFEYMHSEKARNITSRMKKSQRNLFNFDEKNNN